MINNVRQLEGAASQYFIENGTSEAKYTDIVGPGKYVQNIQPVVGEKYPRIFSKDHPVEIIKADGTVWVYDPHTGHLKR